MRSSPAISGVPVKARNSAFGSAARMFSASVSYWLRCASSVEDDHVRAVAEHLRRLELVDQREDVAVVAAQQLAQVRAAPGVALVALGLADRARSP